MLQELTQLHTVSSTRTNIIPDHICNGAPADGSHYSSCCDCPCIVVHVSENPNNACVSVEIITHAQLLAYDDTASDDRQYLFAKDFSNK